MDGPGRQKQPGPVAGQSHSLVPPTRKGAPAGALHFVGRMIVPTDGLMFVLDRGARFLQVKEHTTRHVLKGLTPVGNLPRLRACDDSQGRIS
jgi:hypothetical protein